VRPGKLYIKIFLSFLAVLGATLLVVFSLLILKPGQYFGTRLEDYAKTRALMIQEVLADKIRSTPDAALEKNEPLKTFISDFAKILGARVWLQKQDGTVPLKSFPGEIPAGFAGRKISGGMEFERISQVSQRDHLFYAVMPIAFPAGETGSLHILFDRPEGPFHSGRGLALGLLIIGLMAALLIIPVSRIITNRLEQLRQSALFIAEGNLTHRVAIRGRDEIGDLAQAFNRMADKMEVMIRSGKELTANISHELRTPLTRIRIAEELLRERGGTGTNTPEGRYLDAIREDILELDRLIGRILELSKMEIQDSPLVFSLLDPAQLLRKLLQRFQPVIEQKKLQISTDLSFQPPFSGDREALTSALLNILDNAVKFTPEKGQIDLRMQAVGDRLNLSVTNTFEKQPEEELAKIFDPFHRTRKSRATGSGLGLAIAKKIIERHGGRIGAYNNERGLEIRIVLPREPRASNSSGNGPGVGPKDLQQG
jgi:two-component system sensor histidine kinase CpxA